MMNVRGLLIAVVVLVALAGGVYWSNKSKEAQAAKPAADAAPKILSVPAADITKIAIDRTGESPTIAERKSGTWELTAPKPLPADQDALSSMASTFTTLNADRLIEDKAADYSQYGLTKPALDVTVTDKGGKNHVLEIGDEVPTGNGFYARLQGDPRVFSIASFTKTSLDKTEQDLRDKRLLRFNSEKLTRVELLAKGQDIEFGKNNQNDWQILKPKPLRADGGQVEELIRKLHDAKMDTTTSADDAKNAAKAFASGTQVAVAKVSDSAGTGEITVKKDKDNTYYAKSTAVDGIYKVAADLGTGLDKGLDDFRNKKVFDFGWNDPSKIDIQDGAKQVSYQMAGEKWSSAGKTMDTPSVQALVDKLRDLSATKFADKGFTTPALAFTVTSNGGKRTEKVELAKNGNDWYARRDNEPALYQVDPKAVEDIQKAIAGVKAAPAAKKK